MTRKIPRAIAIDTETTGLFLRLGCLAFMVTAADTDGKTFIWEFPVDPLTRRPKYDKRIIKLMQKTFDQYDTWVFHNSLFDLLALELMGIVIDYEKTTIHDTMLMAHVHNSMGRLGLKPLAFLHLSFPEDDEADLQAAVISARRKAKNLGWLIADEKADIPSLRPQKKDFPKSDYWIPKEVAKYYNYDSDHIYHTACSTYAVKDVERTIGLFYFYLINLDDQDFKCYLKNTECLYPIHVMQGYGFNLIVSRIDPKIKEINIVIEKQLATMRRVAKDNTFNPRSQIDLPKVLYEKLKLEPVAFSKTGNPKNDKEAIKELFDTATTKDQKDFLRALIYFRKLSVAVGYVESYKRYMCEGKLFPSVNPVGTKTVRCACRDPNAQNISKKGQTEDELLNNIPAVNLRSLFGPEPGKLWLAIDYKQLQLCIFAYACKDQTLIKAFADGADIHDQVAKEVFNVEKPSSEERRDAKGINFGIIFGAGKNKIDRMTKKPGLYDKYKRRFPLIASYIDQQSKEIKKNGFCRTMGGYPLRATKSKAYKGCNYVVQGTEGELVKAALVKVFYYCRYHNLPFYPIMVIHDELVIETKIRITPKAFAKKYKTHILEIFRLMNEASAEVGVRTEVDAKIISKSWDETHELELV